GRPGERGVGGRVAHLAVDAAADPDPLPLDRLDQRRGDPAGRGEVVEAQHLLRLDDVAAGFGHGRREIRVGLPELATEHAPDRLERQPLALEIADPSDPLGVDVVVPRHATLPLRLGEQTPRLVVADGVDRDVAGRRQLLDPILHGRYFMAVPSRWAPHDHALYECTLEHSHRQLAWRLSERLRRKVACSPGYDAPREARDPG